VVKEEMADTAKRLELPDRLPISAPKAPSQSTSGPKRSRATMASANSRDQGRKNLDSVQAPTAAGHGRLIVSGCSEQHIAEGVHGVFECCGANHGRPAYKNVEGRSFTAFIYYWDDRVGPEFQGWWMGPKLGGEDVWVRHPSSSELPPQSGWYAPHDGFVDPGLRVRPVDTADHIQETEVETLANPLTCSTRSAQWEKPVHHLSLEEEKRMVAIADVPDGVEAAANMDEEQHAEQTRQDDVDAGKSEFDELQAELEETRRQSDEHVRQLLTLQQQMEERRQREESLLRRMREITVPLAATRTVASCIESLPPPVSMRRAADGK